LKPSFVKYELSSSASIYGDLVYRPGIFRKMQKEKMPLPGFAEIAKTRATNSHIIIGMFNGSTNLSFTLGIIDLAYPEIEMTIQ